MIPLFFFLFQIIDPEKIPKIFENALESDLLAELIRILHDDREKFKEKPVFDYLKAISKVKRFSALSMFLSKEDKLCKYSNKIFNYYAN